MVNPCVDCRNIMAQELRGVDWQRCDRADGNFLNNLLSDTLWPKYSGWVASWLDHLIEHYIEGFGVEIIDETRTVGDEVFYSRRAGSCARCRLV
jgi:hypothetical protein